jgi:hypothetical protein
MSPVGLGHENDCAGENQQTIVNDRPIFSSERMLHKDYNRTCSVENNIGQGRSQGAWLQVELIGRKATHFLSAEYVPRG